MGWREFTGWLEVLHKRNQQANSSRVSPGSWDGAEGDPAWQAMRAERDALFTR